ncbi:MAG: HAD-IA family hydrolase [Gammaproteobacteria bacterium]|nr:HAD-IA family hydrolase [Gammaproteobacteria bacterium]
MGLVEPRETVPTRLVLFDLDGTLADTAPDLAFALNQTLDRHGQPPLPFETIRPHVSHGGAALLKLGFGIEEENPDFDPLRREFLDTYVANIARETTLFPGMEALITELERRAIYWGVVTNKPGWLTDPLVEKLQLTHRAACVISGDTTENRKPHPGPVLHACRLVGTSPRATLYVGDAERDIQAGRRAGTTTLAASFGYIGESDRPDAWAADGIISHPLQVLDWLIPATNG